MSNRIAPLQNRAELFEQFAYNSDDSIAAYLNLLQQLAAERTWADRDLRNRVLASKLEHAETVDRKRREAGVS
ncbi:hypothetical protein A5733_04340 [Mycobacterium sp. NS-7484]|uniref:hypothetical protein n=1 Tax=Mycobacterium sp. NS-7484 TaxID=1834161 RepID=UPI00096D5CBC|nr:hypothetical protein [Mycobacterium sp. NS-7484]OMC00346.1 hypothetical protein A5733_04340 [Mycobacterium sp. NS-7484]